MIRFFKDDIIEIAKYKEEEIGGKKEKVFDKFLHWHIEEVSFIPSNSDRFDKKDKEGRSINKIVVDDKFEALYLIQGLDEENKEERNYQKESVLRKLAESKLLYRAGKKW